MEWSLLVRAKRPFARLSMSARLLTRSLARSEPRSDVAEAAVCILPRGMGRLGRAGRRADGHETHVADPDEAEHLAQIRRRHVDAAAVHAGDEIAAAGEDHDRGPVLEEGLVALRRFKAKRQSGLRDHVDPLLQLV